MKILVILSVLVFYVQAATILEALQAAVHKCCQERNLDEEIMQEISNRDVVPEDDPVFTEYFPCQWKEVDAFNRNDTFNYPRMKVVLSEVVKARYPRVKDPAKTSDEAVEHCKDVPEGDSFGTTSIRVRNCAIQYVLHSLELQ